MQFYVVSFFLVSSVDFLTHWTEKIPSFFFLDLLLCFFFLSYSVYFQHATVLNRLSMNNCQLYERRSARILSSSIRLDVMCVFFYISFFSSLLQIHKRAVYFCSENHTFIIYDTCICERFHNPTTVANTVRNHFNMLLVLACLLFFSPEFSHSFQFCERAIHMHNTRRCDNNAMEFKYPWTNRSTWKKKKKNYSNNKHVVVCARLSFECM